MKKEFTNEVVLAVNGNVSVVGSDYTKKTEKLAELGFSYTRSKGLTFPACFNVEVTDNNSAQVLYDCFTVYSELVNVLYQTTGGFDSEMFGSFLFELFRVLFEVNIHNVENTEWVREFSKKCIKFTLQMARDEAVGVNNITRYYSLYTTKLLNNILTKYDYRSIMTYLGSDGITSCRMSVGQVFITKALWRLRNDYCDISEIVDRVFYSMKMLRKISYNSAFGKDEVKSELLEMTECYKDITECLYYAEHWIADF